MVQAHEQRSSDRGDHDAVMTDHVERILQRVHALGAAVKAHAAEPFVGLGVVVQDSAPLLRAEDLSGGEADALHLLGAEHSASKTPSAVPHRKRLELICAAPFFIAPVDTVPSVLNCARNAYIRFARYLYCAN